MSNSTETLRFRSTRPPVIDSAALNELLVISQSLFSDTEEATEQLSEVVSLIAWLDVDSEALIRKSARLLFERAEARGPQAVATQANQPFFRLLPIERFTLVAVTLLHWSYSQVLSVLEPTLKGEANLQELLWSTRLQLAYAPESQVFLKRKMPQGLIHPSGSSISGAHCPEYLALRPWPQRLIDRGYVGKEKAFLESHVLRCSTCSKAVERTRVLIYAVQSILDAAGLKSPEEVARKIESRVVRRIARAEISLIDRSGVAAVRTLGDALSIFIRRPIGQFFVFALSAWAVIWVVYLLG
ncbi:MAG: hypothetical protein JNL01_00865 [Bdellovibrionales bacterium]|nr:hypothetical protein [Bdellovibrionales bacterium]